ncbi:hypothetical protein AB0M48_30085 [Lentzea sp. NPDC051208]|uniref:hypothetical protein n=1 Tax=Lentzea sp. NPDC051208 TaxID=3154642 RepID=UPI003431AB9D
MAADAMHTVRATVTDLLRRGADHVLLAKHKQHRFYAQLDALSWSAAQDHAIVDTGHERRGHRTIQVLPVPSPRT